MQAASLYVVFKSEGVMNHLRALRGVEGGAGEESEDECASYRGDLGRSLFHDLLLLYQMLLGGDAELMCLEESLHHRVSSIVLLGTYLMLAVVLLMNMLIAQMAKARSAHPRPSPRPSG